MASSRFFDDAERFGTTSLSTAENRVNLAQKHLEGLINRSISDADMLLELRLTVIELKGAAIALGIEKMHSEIEKVRQ